MGAIGAGVGPYGIALDTATGDLFVANHGVGSAAGGDSVSVISGTTNSVIATISVGSNTLWSGPFGVSYDPVNGNVYVVNEHTGNVSVVSGNTLTVVANIPVGSTPYQVTTDPDNGNIYVTDYGSNEVSEISGSTENVLGAVTVGDGPYGIAYASSGPDLLVANQLSGNLSVIPVPFTPPLIASFQATPDPVSLGMSVTINVTVSGGVGALSYAYAGLPSGCLSVDSSRISCTPSAMGNYTVEVWTNDTVGHSATSSLLLGVVPGISPVSVVLTVNPTSIPVGGTARFATVVTGGTAPYTYRYSGLPVGCVSVSAPILSCIPSVSGSFLTTVLVTDAKGGTSSSSTNLTVYPPSPPPPLSATLLISPSPVIAGAPMTVTTNVVGGFSPFTYLYLGLPTGCPSANASTIQCTPQTSGTVRISVLVTDSSRQSFTVSQTVTIQPPSTPKGGGSSTPLGLSFSDWTAVVIAAIATGLLLALATVQYLRRKDRESLVGSSAISRTSIQLSPHGAFRDAVAHPPKSPSSFPSPKSTPPEDDPLEDMI